MAESFFATLKTKFYYRRVWPTRARASREVGAWVEERYNRSRRHSAVGQLSAVAFELQHSKQIADLKAAQTVSTNQGQGHSSSPNCGHGREHP